MTEREKMWFEDANRMAELVAAARGQKLASGQTTDATTARDTVAELVKAGVIQPKAWWTSVGINGSVTGGIASLVMLASVLARAFGWEVDAALVTELVIGLVGLVASAMTWWGRVHAAQPISRTQVLPGVNLGGKP